MLDAHSENYIGHLVELLKQLYGIGLIIAPFSVGNLRPIGFTTAQNYSDGKWQN